MKPKKEKSSDYLRLKATKQIATLSFKPTLILNAIYNLHLKRQTISKHTPIHIYVTFKMIKKECLVICKSGAKGQKKRCLKVKTQSHIKIATALLKITEKDLKIE